GERGRMSRDIDESSENVLYDWSGREQPSTGDETEVDAGTSWGTVTASEPTVDESSPADAGPADEEGEEGPRGDAERAVLDEPADEPADVEEDEDAAPDAEARALPLDEGVDEDAERDLDQLSQEHAAGDLDIPDGYAVLEGVADGARRAVAVVVARFNGEVTSRLLDGALAELDDAGVRQEAITVLVVP